jgi:hypothetical protein
MAVVSTEFLDQATCYEPLAETCSVAYISLDCPRRLHDRDKYAGFPLSSEEQ